MSLSPSMIVLISLFFFRCNLINLWSTVCFTHRRLKNVSSFCPIRNTRQKACCSAASFHHGSMTMTFEAIVKLRPTEKWSARTWRSSHNSETHGHPNAYWPITLFFLGFQRTKRWPCHEPRSSFYHGTRAIVNKTLLPSVNHEDP